MTFLSLMKGFLKMNPNPGPKHDSAANLPILVTGAAGFIGARFVERCNQPGVSGIPVVSVDVLPFFSERAEHQGLDFGKIIDRDDLLAWLEKERPRFRCVVHLGASSSTAEKNWDFLERVNLNYSKSLWSYCAREKIPFLYASSGATYGAGENGFEDDEAALAKLAPLNLYGKSKHLFDIWALEQEKAGHHPPAWAGFKFFNVYGFGERHKGGQFSPILHVFNQVQESGKMKLFKSHHPDFKDGEQRRDFVFVEDVVDVIEFARKGGLRRGIYNVGTGQARTFIDLTRAVFSEMERPERIEFIDTPENLREGYQYFTEASMEKLRRAGYAKPFTSLEEGVSRYVRRLMGLRR